MSSSNGLPLLPALNVSVNASPTLLASLVLSSACLLLYYTYARSSSGASAHPQPPAPPRSSLLWGHKLPNHHPWEQLSAWTATYGGLYELQLGLSLPFSLPFGLGLGALARGRTFVAGTPASAHYLLEAHAAISADRPRNIMAGELVSGNMRSLFMHHGKRWRTFRKVMHQGMSSHSAATYEHIQHEEALRTALAIGDAQAGATLGQGEGEGEGPRETDPQAHPPRLNVCQHIKRFATSVVMTITYAKPIPALDHPAIRRIDECVRDITLYARASHASILDSLPVLYRLPAALCPLKKEGQRLHKRELALFLGEYEEVRARTSSAAAGEGGGGNKPAEKAEAQDQRECFAQKVQAVQSTYSLSDAEASYLSGSFYGAGSDTTSSVLNTFLLGLCSNPSVLPQLHAELDAVVGRARAPAFEDLPNLPYTRAAYQETLRWRPAMPSGMPHRLTEDVLWYPEGGGPPPEGADPKKAYLLPKGSTIVAPFWSISHDEKEYPRPEEFRPERFLGEAEGDGAGAGAGSEGEKTATPRLSGKDSAIDLMKEQDQDTPAGEGHTTQVHGSPVIAQGADATGIAPQPQPQPQTVHTKWFAPRVGSVAFGFGRRACPGYHVAERSVLIGIATLAWAFDIHAPAGEKVDTYAYGSGTVSHPLPFDM